MFKVKPILKNAPVGIVLCAVIVTAGVLVWMNSSPRMPEAAEEEVGFSQLLGQVQIVATDYYEAGDIEGGLRHYDEQIELRKDDEEKKVLLRLKSGFAIRSEQFDVAVAAAEQAHSIGADAKTFRALADAYRASGDSEKALMYYGELPEGESREDVLDRPTVQRGPTAKDAMEKLE